MKQLTRRNELFWFGIYRHRVMDPVVRLEGTIENWRMLLERNMMSLVKRSTHRLEGCLARV